MSDASPPRLRLQAPEVLDLVDADEVGDLVARTEREFAVLQKRAAEAVTAAEQAEASARLVDVDAGATTWTAVRLQRFLDELRAEAERDAASIIEVARCHARMRVEDARATVSRGGTARPPLVIGGVRDEPTERFEVPLPPATGAAVAVPVVSTAASMPEAAVPAPQAAVPVPEAAVPVPEAAVPVREAAVPVPEDVPMAAPPVAPAVALADPPRSELAPAAPPAAPAPAFAVPMVEPTPAPTASDTSRKAKKPSRRATSGRRRFLPLSAVLEIVAVLLLLAFIVMKLS